MGKLFLSLLPRLLSPSLSSLTSFCWSLYRLSSLILFALCSPSLFFPGLSFSDISRVFPLCFFALSFCLSAFLSSSLLFFLIPTYLAHFLRSCRVLPEQVSEPPTDRSFRQPPACLNGQVFAQSARSVLVARSLPTTLHRMQSRVAGLSSNHWTSSTLCAALRFSKHQTVIGPLCPPCPPVVFRTLPRW
jgi:hypothetical protein